MPTPTSQKSLAGWCREAPLYLSYLAFETSPAQAITNCGKPTLERALLFRITLGCKHLLAESTEIDATSRTLEAGLPANTSHFPVANTTITPMHELAYQFETTSTVTLSQSLPPPKIGAGKRRSRAVSRVLKREPRRTVSRRALSRQARHAAARRSAAARSAAARRAMRTKGSAGRSAAARKAARTGARHRS